MKRSRSEVVVPVRDRRQRRRILTLKNFRNASIVIAALVIAVVVEEQYRGNKPSEGFGRLYEPQIETTASVPKVPESPAAPAIDDRDGADASLLSAAARSQILMGEPATTTATAAPVTTTSSDASVSSAPRAAGESHVTIVDGPNGPTIVKHNTDRPVLGGGFGRQ